MTPGLGDTITSKIKAGTAAAAAASSTTVSEEEEVQEPDIVVEDDEEFEDDGVHVPGVALTKVGPIPRPNGQVYYPRMIEGHEDAALLKDSLAQGEHTLYYGPPGTGKTALCDAVGFLHALKAEPTADAPQDGSTFEGPPNDPTESPLARYIHYGFESIVCSVDTTEGDFFGTYSQDPETGHHTWEDGPLLRALRYGIMLYVDEIFLCDTRVLSSTLYPVMDGRTYLTVPMNPRLGRIPVTEGFAIVGAGNPNVPGADYSEALRSRFDHQIEVTSDWSLIRSLGVPQDIITVCRNLDNQRREGTISWSPQTRDLLSYKKALDRRGRPYALGAMLGKTPFEDRPVIRRALEAKFGSVEPLSLGGPAQRIPRVR